MINAIPKKWKNFLINLDVQPIQLENNIITSRHNDFFKLKNKDIRKIINGTKNTTIQSELFWEKKLKFDTKDHYDIAKLTTTESRLRLLHFKILHNIYPTNIILAKMKVKENNLCESCHVPDYLEHFFVHCTQVQEFWVSLKSTVLNDINRNINFSTEMILFGINKLKSREYNLTEKKYLNYLILVAKMCISKFKYGPIKHLSLIFEQEWYLRRKTVNYLKFLLINL